MSKGIAIHFVDKFDMVNQLKRCNAKVGDTVVLKKGHRYIYYLITKPKKGDKPVYQSVRKAIRAMKRDRFYLRQDTLRYENTLTVVKINSLDATVFYAKKILFTLREILFTLRDDTLTSK